MIKGFHPDPSICRKGDDYYLVTSSFEFFPAVPVFHSKDLKTWTKIGHCIEDSDLLNFEGQRNSGGIFAPTIRYHEGTFYMITTDIYKGNFYVTTEDPHKGWSKPIWIDPDVQGIDPSLFFEDGITYVQLASFKDGNHIVQYTIDIETGKRTSEAVEISRGSGGRDVEAPHIYKSGKYYYLMVAEGGTREGHMVTLHRSENIWGPYESYEKNPILSNRDKKTEIQSVGHADFVEIEDGRYAMVALCVRQRKHRHLLGRETILTYASMSEDGWIIPDKDYISDDFIDKTKQNWSFDFRNPTLDLEFNTIRTNKHNKIEQHPNGIKLYDFLGIRQTEYNQTFELELTSDGTSGLKIYKDDEHYSLFYIEDNMIKTFHKNGDFTREVEKELENTPAIKLIIKSDDFSYTFSTETFEVDKITHRHLTSEESNSMFTGIYLGPFTEGDESSTFISLKRIDH